MSRPAIGARRTRVAIAPVTVPAQPDAYDPAAVDRAVEAVADVANALAERPPLAVTAGTVTVRRAAITLVAGAGVTITVADSPATDSATITFTSP